MKLNLSARIVAAICQFKSERDIRYYLNGVYVEPIEGGGAMVIATNGFSMGIWRDASGVVERPAVLRIGKRLEAECTGSDLKRLTIIDDRLAVLMTNVKAAKKEAPMEQSEIYIQHKQGTKPGSWEIEGKFPNWRNVIPTEPDGCMPHDQVDPKFLSQIKRAIKLGSGVNTAIVAMFQPSRGAAIGVFCGEAREFFGIVMPCMTATGECSYPEWVKQISKKKEQV